KKTRRELIRLGHQPTPQLIAEYLDVDESEVMRVAAQLDAPPVFLDAQAPGHEKRSEEHTSELQSRENLVCRLLLEKKKTTHLKSRLTRRQDSQARQRLLKPRLVAQSKPPSSPR